MLTREQVEKIKTYGKWGDDIDALCEMALAWLDVQPRVAKLIEIHARWNLGEATEDEYMEVIQSLPSTTPGKVK